MPIPTTVADLDVTAANNSPAGGDAVGTIDDYIRAHASIIKQVSNDSLTAGLATASGMTLSATDKILGRSTSGAGAVEEITCTAAGRALLDDADAAAQRTTLGLGSAATLTAGTSANNVVQLDSSAKLPAVDGSQLINVNVPAVPYETGKYYLMPNAVANATTGGTISSTQTQGKIYFCPFLVTSTQTFSSISCAVSANESTRTVRLGVYSNSNSLPSALIYDAGTVSISTGTDKDIAFGQSLSPGWYWLAFMSDATGTATFYNLKDGLTGYAPHFFQNGLSSPTATSAPFAYKTQTYGAMPSTVSGLSKTNVMPVVALKA